MRAYGGKELPTLDDGQYALVQVEGWTGKVLTIDGERYNGTNNSDWVLIFDGLEEAENYARKRIDEVPGLQCSIYDHNKRVVKTIAHQGRRRSPPLKPSYQWWKFWRWRFR